MFGASRRSNRAAKSALQGERWVEIQGQEAARQRGVIQHQVILVAATLFAGQRAVNAVLRVIHADLVENGCASSALL